MPLGPHAGELRVFALIGLIGTGLIAPPQEVTRADRYERRIIFDSDRDGNIGVYAMDPDGANPQRLTDGNQAGLPAWSPDGKKVAFGSNREGHFEIYVMDLDGFRLQRLTYTARENSGNPAWSPDGRKIAFESDRDGNWEIYVMSADGSNVKRLTHSGGDSENPDWRPDGKRIAFDSGLAGATREIYIMDPDGSNVQQLTHTPGKTLGSEHPAWSPAGKRIAFDSSWDHPGFPTKWEEGTEIYVMDSDGRNVQRLSNTTGAANLCPVWSPDGKRIVFMSTRDSLAERWPQSAELYVMGSNGANVRRLTFNRAFDAHPSW